MEDTQNDPTLFNFHPSNQVHQFRPVQKTINSFLDFGTKLVQELDVQYEWRRSVCEFYLDSPPEKMKLLSLKWVRSRILRIPRGRRLEI